MTRIIGTNAPKHYNARLAAPACLAAALLLAGVAPAARQEKPATSTSQQGKAAAPPAPAPRFDELVRSDFFAGLAGDKEKLDRAMKVAEDTLAKNPKNAEAMVWHGGGVYFESKDWYMKGDYVKGGQFMQDGLREMDEAVALAPDNIGVLIPRAAVLLGSAPHVPMPDMARQMFEKATGDYEKILRIQADDFATMPVHSRGELLGALAEGWHALGNDEKSRGYLQRMVKDAPNSAYAKKAAALLEALPPKGPLGATCLGCHVSAARHGLEHNDPPA